MANPITIEEAGEIIWEKYYKACDNMFKGGKMKDLGEVSNWDFEPKIIDNCRAQEHTGEDEPIKNSHAKHRATCEICGYTYTYLCHSD